MIEFIKHVFTDNNASGNAFHCIRTFHLFSLFADFLESGDAVSRSSVDVLFAQFSEFCSRLSEHALRTRFGVFVPLQYTDSIRSCFRKLRDLSAEVLASSDECPRLTADAINRLLLRQVFPPEHHSVIEISVDASDDVTRWQAATFLYARLPTYTRRLMDAHAIPMVLPYSASENSEHFIRFAVSTSPQLAMDVARCFSEFWRELLPYTSIGVKVTAAIDGADFFSAVDLASLLTRSLDPAVVSIIADYAASSATEALHLPETLNSQQRAIAHTFAEAKGLKHTSEGTGMSRHIVLRKGDN